MKTRTVQLCLGVAAIAGATVLGCFDKDGWSWLILAAFFCIPGCMT